MCEKEEGNRAVKKRGEERCCQEGDGNARKGGRSKIGYELNVEGES